MFRNVSIGSRLIVILILINTLILIAIGAIATISSDTALEDQAVSRFASKNQQAAAQLDVEFNKLQNNIGLLVRILAGLDDPADAIALRESLVNFVSNDSDDTRIYRVSVYLPETLVGVLNLSDPAVPTSFDWRVYRNRSEWPTNRSLLAAVYEEEAIWVRQSRTLYDSQQRPSISLVSRFAWGESFGLLWMDVPTSALRALVTETLNSVGLLSETSTGYALILDPDNVALSANNLPARYTVTEITRNIQLLQGRINASQANEFGLFELTDSFSRQGAFISSTLFEANGWRFISSFPYNEIPALPYTVLAPVALVATVGLMVLTAAINVFTRRTVVAPLRDLGQAARQIGGGDMRYFIAYRDQRDEIGQLAGAMEDMKRRLAQSYDELGRVNRSLEKRVQDRTQQLEVARKQAQSAAEELRAIYGESLLVVTENRLKPVLDAFITRICSLLKANYAAVWLLSEDEKRLQLVATNEARHEENMVISAEEGLAGQTYTLGKPQRILDYATYPHRLKVREFYDQTPFRRGMSMPLVFVGRPIGIVIVGRPLEAEPFSEDDERLLNLFTNLVAPSVRNAELYVRMNDARDEAERANQVKTRFLASVTHELRTPLNLVINNTDFMRLGAFGPVTEDQKNRLNQTLRSAEHLLELINDLLDVSKIEAGEMQLFIQQSDVYTVLEDTMDTAYAFIEKLGGTRAQDVLLNIEIEPGLPLIPMDVRRIRQVLTNLMSNAIKFTEKGSVSLVVKRAEKGIYFAVQDTGMGIAPEEMQALFAAFERTESAKAANIEGTGLGLPISAFLVQAHGGDLKVESAVGQGSTFSFVLPYISPSSDSGRLDKSIVAALTSKSN